MTATIITRIAATTGTTRFKLAMKIFIGSSSLPPPFTSGSSRAGAMVPGTKNMATINPATIGTGYEVRRCLSFFLSFLFFFSYPLLIAFLFYLPPVTVSVANSYSATANPALLWAVTRRWYHVAGTKSRTTKFPPGLTLFDTWFHSCWFLNHTIDYDQQTTRTEQLVGLDSRFYIPPYFFLCSTTK